MTSARLPTKGGRCAQCGFWIRVGRAPCPNCGRRLPIFDPSGRLQDSLALASVASLVVLGIVFLLGSMWGQPPASANAHALDLASRFTVRTMLAASAASGLVALLIRALKSTHRGRNLCQYEKSVAAKLREVMLKQEKIDRIRGHLRDAPTNEASARTERLLSESELVLRRYRAKYDAEMLRLRALRLQNRLEEILSGIGGDDYYRSERRLKALKAVMVDAGELLEALAEDSQHLDERSAESAMEELRDHLQIARLTFQTILNQQVVNAVRDLSPLDSARPVFHRMEIVVPAQRPDRVRAVEALHRSLEELQEQYDRMEAERELMD